MFSANNPPLNSTTIPLLSTKDVNLETETVAVKETVYLPSGNIACELIL